MITKIYSKRVLKKSFISVLIVTLATPTTANNTFNETFKNSATEGKEFGSSANSEFRSYWNDADEQKEYRKIYIDPSDFTSDSVKDYSIFDPLETSSCFQDETVKDCSQEAKERLYNNSHTENLGNNDLSSAYQVLTDTRVNFSGIDLSSDPIASSSESIYSDLDEKNDQKGYFSDCSKTVSYKSQPNTDHVPQYVHCNRLRDFSGECTISHTMYADPVVSLVKGGNLSENTNFLNILPCDNGESCFVMWVGDSYGQKANWCSLFEDYLYINVNHPEAITDAYLSYVGWDDYFAVFIGRDNQEELLFNTTGTLPIMVTSLDSTTNTEAQGEFLAGKTVYVDLLNGHRIVTNPKCENEGEDCFFHRCNDGLEIHQSKTASGKSLLSIFKNARPSDPPLVMHTLTSTADVGGYQAKLKVYYDPDKVVIRNEWNEPECVERARSVDDQFSSGEYYCEKYFDGVFEEQSGEKCILSAGVKLCESQLIESTPLKNISPLCEKVSLRAKTEYFKTADDLDNYNLDGCTKYHEKCTFISTKCLNDAVGISGNCYEHEDIYDCGKDLDDQHTIAEISYDCNGIVRCIGTECVDESYDVSVGFEKTSALLQAAQFMGQDMECDGVDGHGNPIGDKNVSCKVFSGIGKSCAVSMKGLGGLEVNCCESPGGISPAEYIAALMYLPKIDSMIARTGPDSMIYGAYNYIREPIFNTVSQIGNTLTDVTKPFASWVENNFGLTRTTSNVDSSITSKILSTLKDKAKEIIRKLIVRAHTASMEAAGDSAAGNVLTDETMAQIEERASEQAAAIIDGLGSCITVVGYVYMAYQIASMASQMIFKCTDEQLQLAGQKELGNCSYVGQFCSKKVLHTCVQKTFSYCCYSSPLSRIIQEQIHAQLGTPIASLNPKNPDCGGIGTDQLDKVDWTAIDLSEWTALLKVTGNYPDETKISLDGITGKDSPLNLDYSNTGLSESERLNAAERTVERIYDIDTDKVNREVNSNTLIDFKGK